MVKLARFRLIILLVFFSLYCFAPAVAQFDEDYDEQEKDTTENKTSNDQTSGNQGNFWDRVYIGGNMSLQFGSVTYIDVSPLAGYRITERLSAGLGGTYQYLKYNNYFGFDGSFNTYGGRVFARHTILSQFFVHTEYEALSTRYLNQNLMEFKREWVPGFFVGGGLFQGIGNKGGFNITILYNLLHDDERSIYDSPWVVRAGFTLSPF